MKKEIIIFIIGLLLGSIISTGSIFIYTKANSANTSNNETTQMPGGNGGEMPSGGNMQQEPPTDIGQASTN